MTKTFKVEGMMCPHCEANVKKALEAVEGITAAVPSHEKGIVEVTMDESVGDDTVKAVIEDKGYNFCGLA